MIRTYKKIDKKGREEEWSWEETPEFKTALKNYHDLVTANRFKCHSSSVG